MSARDIRRFGGHAAAGRWATGKHSTTIHATTTSSTPTPSGRPERPLRRSATWPTTVLSGCESRESRLGAVNWFAAHAPSVNTSCARQAGPAGVVAPIEPSAGRPRGGGGVRPSSFAKSRRSAATRVRVPAMGCAAMTSKAGRRGRLHQLIKRPGRHRGRPDRTRLGEETLPDRHQHPLASATQRGCAVTRRGVTIDDVTAAYGCLCCGVRQPGPLWSRSRMAARRALHASVTRDARPVPVLATAGHVRGRVRLGALRAHRLFDHAVGSADGGRWSTSGMRPAGLPRDRRDAAGEGLPVWGSDITPRPTPTRGTVVAVKVRQAVPRPGGATGGRKAAETANGTRPRQTAGTAAETAAGPDGG